MRLHIGVAPGKAAQGQAALVFVEHQQTPPREVGGRVEVRHVVVHVEKVEPSLEAIRGRIEELAKQARAERPCFFLDATTSLGAGVFKVIAVDRRRGEWPAVLHPVHPYIKRGVARQPLIHAIVEAYGTGRLSFAAGVPLREELIKAMGTWESEVADDGKLSFGGEEELVVALGLAMAYHQHGHTPRYLQRGGTVVHSRAISSDAY